MKEIKEIEDILKSDAFGKFGLKGNHGFVCGRHIQAPYDCNGLVFVEKNNYWERMKPEDITNEKIIKCTYCAAPAIRLDHCWPDLKEMTTCHEHLNEFEKQES